VYGRARNNNVHLHFERTEPQLTDAPAVKPAACRPCGGMTRETHGFGGVFSLPRLKYEDLVPPISRKSNSRVALVGAAAEM
jgi:hypothetical protein